MKLKVGVQKSLGPLQLLLITHSMWVKLEKNMTKTLKKKFGHKHKT